MLHSRIIVLRNVDLPEPTGPITAQSCPGKRNRFMSLRENVPGSLRRNWSVLFSLDKNRFHEEKTPFSWRFSFSSWVIGVMLLFEDLFLLVSGSLVPQIHLQ
jgi:hypothetical protein